MNPARTALICGVSGQDGAYLARLLLDRGYAVHGASRDAELSGFGNLAALGIRGKIAVHSAMPTDFRSAFQVVRRVAPDEIYNLSGQSSVGLSFAQPAATLESIVIGTLNILEVIRTLDRPIRFYNAGSGECFGDTDGAAADENTAFRPRSPYAVAKAAAEQLTEVKRSLPPGITVRPVLDRSRLVNATIDTVAHNLFYGAALVIAVLFGLLGNLRAAFLTALAIPLSMLLAAAGMHRAGISGNLMSLGAIAFGIIIDGSVIIVENCLRRLTPKWPGDCLGESSVMGFCPSDSRSPTTVSSPFISPERRASMVSTSRFARSGLMPSRRSRSA